MQRKKYAIHPGYMLSKTDTQRHFVSYNQLVKLYRVSPDECFEWLEGYSNNGLRSNYVHLYPDFTGKYEVPNEK